MDAARLSQCQGPWTSGQAVVLQIPTESERLGAGVMALLGGGAGLRVYGGDLSCSAGTAQYRSSL